MAQAGGYTTAEAPVPSSDFIIYRKGMSLSDVRSAPAVEARLPEPSAVSGGLCGVVRDGCAVEAHEFPNGRGLRVTRALAAGDTVMSVPLDQCWSPDTARACPDLVGLEALPDEDIMALHLLVERSKGRKAWNAAHIASLPQAFDIASFWSEAERAELDDELQQTTRKLKVQVESDFDSAKNSPNGAALVKKYGIDIDGFRWAKAVMWSRCSDLAGVGKRLRFLMPGFDLANHDPSLPVSHSIKDGDVVVKATKDYAEGDEFHINYGSHLNKHLLQWYGFVLDENPEQNICFEFPVVKAFRERLQTLGANIRPCDQDSSKIVAGCLVTCREPLPQAMVFAAAVCNDVAGLDDGTLNPGQEVAALDLLTKILPPRPEVPPLPDFSQYRKRCAAVMRTTDERLLVAFHDALAARKKVLVRKLEK